MSGKVVKTSPRSQQQSRLSIFFRNLRLLKIIVWLASLSFIATAGVAWADLQPISSSDERVRIFPTPAFTAAGIGVVQIEDLDIDNAYLPIDLQPSPAGVSGVTPHQKSQPRLPSRKVKIFRPQHTDLLTAANYTVSVNSSSSRAQIAERSIEIPVPAPLHTTIPDRRVNEIVTASESQIQPSYIKPQRAIDLSMPATSIQSQSNSAQPIDSHLTVPEIGKSPTTSIPQQLDRLDAHRPSALSTQKKSVAGLKSTVVTPMKPRLQSRKSTAESKKARKHSTSAPARASKQNQMSASSASDRHSNILPVTRSPQTTSVPTVPTRTRLGSTIVALQPKPIAFVDTVTNEEISKNAVETDRNQHLKRIAKSLEQTPAERNLKEALEINPDRLKQKFALASNTQLTVGVKVLEATDLTDTINPMFDGNSDSNASRFGIRSGIYHLVAGSGLGVRHQFSPNLEGSVGFSFRSSADMSQTSQSSGQVNDQNMNGNNSFDNSFNSNEKGLLSGGSLTNNYGTIAQITYSPSQNVKLGIAYVYAYNVIPEIGSESANQIEGGNNAFGLQSFVRLDPNLALGGWVGYNQNKNADVEKNIFTWALTAAIPDLGGKGNLAGIVVGQEPRVIAASNPEARDTGDSFHLEGFYQIKISEDFSITPALVYLTGSNIENVKSDAGAVIGEIGLQYSF